MKNTIPNISDVQVIAAFQAGLRDDDLIKKIGIFMGGPTPVEEYKEPKEIRPEDSSSSTTATRIQMIAMMTMLMKLEQISWSLQPKNISSRPPHQ